MEYPGKSVKVTALQGSREEEELLRRPVLIQRELSSREHLIYEDERVIRVGKELNHGAECCGDVGRSLAGASQRPPAGRVSGGFFISCFHFSDVVL